MQTDPTFRTGKNFLPVKYQYGADADVDGGDGDGGDVYAPQELVAR